MKRYESTATVRKDLVKKLAEITGQKPKYSGMPKCEYQLPGFVIDRGGDLLAEDDADMAVIAKLMEAGLITDGTTLADEKTVMETEPETTEENTMEIMPEAEPESATETMPENTLETATETTEEAVREAEQTDDREPQETIVEPQALAAEPQEGTESAAESETDTGAEEPETATGEAIECEAGIDETEDGADAMDAEDTAETQQEPDADFEPDAVQTTVNIEAGASADDADEAAEIEAAETDAAEADELGSDALESGEAQEPETEDADGSETEDAAEITETFETDEIAEAEEAAAEDGIDLSQPFCLPLGSHNGVSLRNLINLFYSRGPLVGKATGGRFRVSEGLVDALEDDSCTYNMANFRKALRDYEEKNGDSGMEGVGITEDGILISGFPTAPDLEHYTAWGQLAVLMNNQALVQNRIQAKTVNDENEKYSIRVWMVRLGMNGDSFRQTRKILMENLSGHAAFRTAEQAEAFKKKEKRKRDALKAAKATAEASGHQAGNGDGGSGDQQIEAQEAESHDAAEAAD